jgi:hypothetical protein
VTGTLHLLSFICLALALLQDFGDFTLLALLLVLLSLGLVVAGLATSRSGGEGAPRRWWLTAVVAAGLSNLLNLGFPGWIGVRWSDGRDAAVIILVLALTAAASAAVASTRRAAVILALAGVLALGLLVATWPAWGAAPIDVFHVVTGGAGALVHGSNPYRPVFSYVAAITPSKVGEVSGHFAYGPIVPVLASLGWLLGDVRVASVVALAATVAGLWVLARQQEPAIAPARAVVALAICSPLAVAMVQDSWVEIYIVAGMVGWLALRRRHRPWAIAALAVALLVNAITLVALLPWLIWSRRARFEGLVAAAAAVVFALPFALATGIGNFLYDVIGIQVTLEPRYDALTLTSALWQAWHLVLPSWLPVIPVLLAVAFIIRRGRPVRESDLPAMAALMVLATFLLAKWAFLNYYYVAAMMLLAATASAGLESSSEDLALPDLRWPAAAGRRRRQASPSPARAAPTPAGDGASLLVPHD